MGIYGDNLTRVSVNKSLLERYIDDCFLESSLGLSDIEKEIKALKDKDNLTESDIKKVYNKIQKIENDEQRKRLNTYFLTMLIGMFSTWAGAIISGENPLLAAPIMIVGILLVIGSGKAYDNAQVDDLYYKLMKIEAKAKVAKDKAEKLDDKEQAKECQKVIDACEKLKVDKRRSLRDKALRESTMYEDSDLLLEYKGNDVKNNIFIQVLKDVDDICKMNMDKISAYEDILSKMLSIGRTSNSKNVKDNLLKCRNIGRDANNKLPEISKDYYGPLTFDLIKKEVRKFNNKYGSISMQEKKKLADKLNKYKDKLNTIGENYSSGSSSFNKECINILDKIESFDVAARREFADLLSSWLDGLLDEVNYTIGDINYVLKLLDIERLERSIIYKALNLR